MEHHRAVVLRQWRFIVAHAQGLQVTDALLHPGQHGGVSGFGCRVKQVQAQGGKSLLGAHHIVKSVQLAHEITPLTSPGGQQGVGVQVHVLERWCHVQATILGLAPLTPGVAATLGAEKFAPFHDVAPIKTAGVGHGQHHLTARRHRGQQRQQTAGNVAHAKHHHTARQVPGNRFTALQLFEHLALQIGAGGAALLGREGAQHRPPQRRLPALVFRQSKCLTRQAGCRGQFIPPGGPGLQPIGAVVLILVKQVGQLAGQLQQPRVVCAHQR